MLERRNRIRQQRPHLQPVKQQANRFETHFSLPGAWVLCSLRHLVDRLGHVIEIGHGTRRTRYSKKISLPWILIKYPSTQCPTSVKKAAFGCGFEEAAPFVVTPSSKEATESVIEANLDPDFALRCLPPSMY